MSPGQPECRFCGTKLKHTLINLGASPLCQSLISEADVGAMEPFYPLHAYVCHNCYLAQVEEFVPVDDIFSEYAYFSSFSDSWVEHAKRYCLEMRDRLDLGAQSSVVEVASNDGYLLQHFVELGIPCYGIEPAANVAKSAIEKGVPTEIEFFGSELAEKLSAAGRNADLIIGNNVLAQVPRLNDFVASLKTMMRPGGLVTIEFPHLLATIEGGQFDQIYHEHFSYFSLFSAKRIFAHHGIRIFDIEEINTHGGSLRIFGCHKDDASHRNTERLLAFEAREKAAGIDQIKTYERFADNARATKHNALEFLISAARAGKQVVGYGAPGKGNTFLNYCGIKSDLIAYTVDRNPYKQSNLLPGSRIPIFAPEKFRETRPDVIVILPWNIAGEIAEQLSYTEEWGAEIVTLVPNIQHYSAACSGCGRIEIRT
jgi:2-polyprenyl-3-methyl-5-hydroxy-6-metoxy-1,4-benzoquinol methylase